MPDKRVNGFLLQERPRIYVCSVPGRWLLDHCVPSWRSQNPVEGFQRIVRQERTRQIAFVVLDQRRTFPNAIVLATDQQGLTERDCKIRLPADISFLVVDGQHRLWAQRHSDFEAEYACVVHCGLDERTMAELFLEINDNQKRVPSSLRWDLVRLVRPDDDPDGVRASELIWELATDRNSPLFQGIDLTGEQSRIRLKQGSLAPEIKTLISSRRGTLRDVPFDQTYQVLVGYFAAIRSLSGDGWWRGTSPFAKPRVIRVLIRALGELTRTQGMTVLTYNAPQFLEFLSRIDAATLADDRIRAAQGKAGMREIQNIISEQLFGGAH